MKRKLQKQQKQQQYQQQYVDLVKRNVAKKQMQQKKNLHAGMYALKIELCNAESRRNEIYQNSSSSGSTSSDKLTGATSTTRKIATKRTMNARNLSKCHSRISSLTT